jgi:hypothetical protein
MEFIVVRNIISQMIVNPEFSDRTEFSVGTIGRLAIGIGSRVL